MNLFSAHDNKYSTKAIDGVIMKAVTISPKYQIVIPRDVRETLRIKPGDKMQVLNYANRIELVPVRKLNSMRGFLKEIDTIVVREKDRLKGN